MKKYKISNQLINGKEDKILVSYRLKKETIDDIDRLSEENNISKTEVVNIAISNLVNR